MKKHIKLQTSLVFVFMVISVLLSRVFFPQWKNEALNEFFNALGLGVIMLGFLFRLSARGYKIEKSDGGRRLVTDGPYALMRQPMYFGTFLIGLGVISVLFNWWVFPLFLPMFLLVYTPQVRREEEKLRAHFGGEYEDYCKRTPRCFPSIKTFFKSDLRDHLPLKWRRLRKELTSLLGTILVVIVIETREGMKLFELFLISAFYFAILSLSLKRKHS